MGVVRPTAHPRRNFTNFFNCAHPPCKTFSVVFGFDRAGKFLTSFSWLYPRVHITLMYRMSIEYQKNRKSCGGFGTGASLLQKRGGQLFSRSLAQGFFCSIFVMSHPAWFDSPGRVAVFFGNLKQLFTTLLRQRDSPRKARLPWEGDVGSNWECRLGGPRTKAETLASAVTSFGQNSLAAGR